MKVLIVPQWLTKVLECNHLSKSTLLDMEILSQYLSRKDLQDYARVPYAVAPVLHNMYDIDLPIQHVGSDDMPGANLCVPRVSDHTSALDRMGDQPMDAKDVDSLLIGHHRQEGHRLVFDVEVFTTKASEDVIGLFVRLENASDRSQNEASAEFLEQLAGVLYARNHGLRDLCAEGILGAYINKVG